MANSSKPERESSAASSRTAPLWSPSTRSGAHSGLTDLGAFGLEAAQASARERTAESLNLCRPVLALRAVLFVLGALALGALLAADDARDWLARMDALALAALAGSLLWLATVCAAKGLLARQPAAARAAIASALGGLAALLGWALVLPLGLVSMDPWRALSALAVGMGLALALWAWVEQRTRAAQPADAKARLAELQSRIRPHFLFNALNTAITLVQVDPQRAEGMLEDLAELFRVALAEAGASVSLDEEIDIARRYLAIEQLRFGKRLQLDWDLDPAAAQARVPPLVLQPLVENAVRHGVEPAAGGGRVRVRTQARHGMARVLVSNTVSSSPSRPGAGMALANVRERVRLLHDLGGSLETWRDGDQFHARLSVPL